MPLIYVTDETRQKLDRIIKAEKRPLCTEVEIMVDEKMVSLGLVKSDIREGEVGK